MKTIETTNLDFAGFLDVKGYILIDTNNDSKGICTWTFECSEDDKDPWMRFLRREEVPAILYAESLRRCKKTAFEKHRKNDVIVTKRRR